MRLHALQDAGVVQDREVGDDLDGLPGEFPGFLRENIKTSTKVKKEKRNKKKQKEISRRNIKVPARNIP